jgi:hypothetical protein
MMELVQQLVSSTGVSEQQAEGGAGLIMGLLKDQLASGDFSQLADAVPEANSLIDSAPSGGGMGGLLGSVAGALGGGDLGNLAKLAGGFSDLGLDSGMIGKFIPVVLSFIQEKGGEGLAGIVANVLQGD